MKILITDPITDAGISILEQSSLDVLYLPESSEADIKSVSSDVEGWIIRSGTKIDEHMIHVSKNLRVIGRAGVGVDNIDIQTATRKGIVVMNTPDVNTISAAEHTIALMLSLSRNIHLGHLGLEKGEWHRHRLIGTELRGKTLGIVGLGKIGCEVMQRCRSFGMKIIGYDPFVNEDMFSKNEIEIVELDSLTSRSDYISVHVPLNDNTKDLFNLDRLRSMKPSARIINVARGGIINEEDLSKALRDSEIAGAAIDVFTVEPIDANHPLVGVPNILLSPHLGASTSEAREGVSRSICEQVRDYLLNEKLVNAVNIPIANLSKLNEIKSFLDLSELLGRIQSQIIKGPIKKVFIECQGTADEIKLISLAFLKGVLQEHVPDRINYINAETIAKELGLEVLIRYSSVESNYNNLISSIVTSHGHEYQFDGSVFDDHNPRLVNVLGREMEVLPKGTMLFIENNDVPGVIGSVGTFLGSLNINIAAYLLNRNVEKDNAFAVIRLDNSLNNEDLINLKDFKDIQSVKQINIEYSNKTISF